MMKYKAFVSDFDGTLVDKTFKISQNVQTAIKKYTKGGGIFSVATGRDYYGVLKKISIDLGLDTYHIVRGGAEIVNTKTHEVVWGKYIKEDSLQRLLDFLYKQNNIYFVAEKDDLMFTKGAIPEDMFGADAKYADLKDLPKNEVPKIFFPYSKNNHETMLSLYEKLHNLFPELHIIKTGRETHIGLDINEGGVSKHLALLEYSKLMEINPKEIAGIGDSYNDYPLLSACGLKIAMGNAPSELKEIADYVVADQANDGVAEAIDLVLSL